MEFSFSTSSQRHAERFDYWRDVVCQHCIPAASHSPFMDDFDATITGRTVGPLAIATMEAPEHSWSRQAEDIRRGPESGLWLSFMESGVAYLEQGGRSVVQKSGDIVLYDAARPFTYNVHPQTFYIMRIPRDLLKHRIAAAERLVAVSLGTGSGFKAVLGSLIKEVSQSACLSEISSAASWSASSILDLLACIIDLHEGHRPQSVTQALYARACSYIHDNIHDPELSVAAVAQSERISLRTLARVFAAHGTTPMRYIWQKRLEASYRAIAEGSVRKVSEAAMNYGFSDLSHFSRTFKKTYGVSPQTLMLRR